MQRIHAVQESPDAEVDNGQIFRRRNEIKAEGSRMNCAERLLPQRLGKVKTFRCQNVVPCDKGHAYGDWQLSERPLESVVGPAAPPRKDDMLFGLDEDWHLNACVNYSHWPEQLYSDGYRLAARFLAERVCESRQELDALIYPIVYLYRHHCELVLKSITVVASALLNRKLADPEVNALGRHGLIELWTNLRPLLNRVCEAAGNPPFPEEDLDGIESYIEQLNEHDSDGQRFRYATVKRQERKKAKTAKKPIHEP